MNNKDIQFVKDVAKDVLKQVISTKEAQKAYDVVAKSYNPESANFFYELKNYFIN